MAINEEHSDDLEWWEIPESSIRYMETLRQQRQAAADERRRKENEKQRNYRAARKHKLFLIERDGAKCQRCGATDNLCVDHIVPLASGGSNDLDNLQLLCGHCNLSKGAK
jgi:5-methylcytosine-specific restriction enzyme A